MMVEYIDIKEKKYKASLENVTFYFTSQRNLDKFLERCPKRAKELDEQFLSRYKTFCDTTLLSAFDVYRRVELRDFLINVDGVDFSDYRSIAVRNQITLRAS